MTKLKTLTSVELAAAADRGDYDLLWREAAKHVPLIIKQLVRDGKLDRSQVNEDLHQDGYLACGDAIRTWQPLEGTLGTWLRVCAGGAILNSAARASSGMVGGRNAWVDVVSIHGSEHQGGEDDETLTVGVEAIAAYDTLSSVLRDPADTVETALDEERARAIIAKLRNPDDREFIQRIFGIDRPEETQDNIAKEMGVSRRTVIRRYGQLLETMRILA